MVELRVCQASRPSIARSSLRASNRLFRSPTSKPSSRPRATSGRPAAAKATIKGKSTTAVSAPPEMANGRSRILLLARAGHALPPGSQRAHDWGNNEVGRVESGDESDEQPDEQPPGGAVETAIGEKAYQHADQDRSGKIKATSACHAHGPEERHALAVIPARLCHTSRPCRHFNYTISARRRACVHPHRYGPCLGGTSGPAG